MPPLSSTTCSPVGKKHLARCPPWYPQSDLSQRLHMPMSSSACFSLPTPVKAPLLHAPTPSLVAQAALLQQITAALITPAVYYSRLSFGTRTLLPDLQTHGLFTVFGQCNFDLSNHLPKLTSSLGQTTAMVPIRRTVTLHGSTPTSGKSFPMPVQPIFSVIWTPTGKITKAMTRVSGHTNGGSMVLVSALSIPAATTITFPMRKLSHIFKRRSISSRPSLLIRFGQGLIDIIVRTSLTMRLLVSLGCWDCSF